MGLLALLDRFTEFFFQQISAKHSPRHPHGLNTRSSEQGVDVWVVIGGVAGCMSVTIAIIGLHKSNRVALMSRFENRVVGPSNTPNVNMAVASTHGSVSALPPVALGRQRLPTTLYPAVPDRDPPNIDMAVVSSIVAMVVTGTHGNAPALPPAALGRQRLPTTPHPAAPRRQFTAPVRSLLHEPARPDPIFSSEFAPRIGGVATWPAYKRPI